MLCRVLAYQEGTAQMDQARDAKLLSIRSKLQVQLAVIEVE